MTFPTDQQGWEVFLQGKFDRQETVEHLKNHRQARDDFKVIMLLAQGYAWRAAWLIRDAIQPQDDFSSFIPQAIEVLPRLKDGHQREILKVLELLTIDEATEGPLFDVCMGIWESPGKSPSVRMNAMLFILKMVKKYPELQAELTHLTQAHYMESLSPGVKRALEKRVRLLK